MRKFLTLLVFTAAIMLAFTACDTNATEPITVEQATPTMQNSQQGSQTNEQTSQEPLAAPLDSVIGPQTQTGQADTSDRIRQFHATFIGIADTMDRWTNELDMTIDEIFDYVLATGSCDLFIQTNADVSALVNRVSFDSIDASVNTRDFINTVHQAYTVTRLFDLVNGWADELGMTIDEMTAYSGDTSRLSNALGIAFEDFRNALTQVNTAFVAVAGHVERR